MNRARISLLVVAGWAVLLLVGCHGHEAHVGIPAGPEAYDERFLKWLVNHHNDDDRMIDPCAKNETIRKELRDFCTSVDQLGNALNE